MIEWSEAYAIGEENIDRHHRELFKAINRLEGPAEPAVMAAQLERTLHFLEQYVRLHFSYEEKCMEQYHCAAAEQNYQAHKEFQKTLGVFRAQHRQEGCSPALTKEVHAYCEQWITNHICKVDLRLKDVLPPPEAR